MSSLDIDRGWAFVIMFCNCLVQMLTVGLAGTTGVLYTTFLDVFQESPSYTAWAVNTNMFVLCVLGELATLVFKLTSLRISMLIGALISTTGLLACSFAQSLLWFFVMFDIVTAVGFSLSFFAILTITPQYFIKYRVIAFAVGSSGFGLGQFFYAPLLRVLVDVYTWRGAFIILAAINMNLCVVAAAMIPPSLNQERHGSSEMQRLVSNDSAVDRKTSVRQKLMHQLQQLRLFRRPAWLLCCIGSVLQNISISAFFTHISKFGLVLGFNGTQAAFVASVLGIGGFAGRILFGLIAHHPRVHVIGLFVVLMGSMGIINILTAFISTYIGLLICSFVCGICIGSFAGFAEVIIHITGVELLSTGLSYAFVFVAVGMLLGGPMGAWIYEHDITYRWSFVISGLHGIIGSSLMFPVWLRCRNGKIEQTKSFDELKLLSTDFPIINAIE